MVERFIAPVLKTGEAKVSVGSNPTPSAMTAADPHIDLPGESADLAAMRLALDEAHRGRQARPAGADDNDRAGRGRVHAPRAARRAASNPGGLPLTQVRQASHSLRIGVRLMR